MEEEICHIEILRHGGSLICRVETGLGGFREIEGDSFEELLRMLVDELREEFESFTMPREETF